MKKGIFIAIGVIVLIGLFFVFNKMDEEKKATRIDYTFSGKVLNDDRLKKGIPIVEDDWTYFKDPSDDKIVKWTKPIRSYNKPLHIYKYVSFADDSLKVLSDEEDKYAYQVSQDSLFRLYLTYDYSLEKLSSKLLLNREIEKYDQKDFAVMDKWILTLEQADSVLENWGLKR